MTKSILACLLCVVLAASCSSERATAPATAPDSADGTRAAPDPPTTGAQVTTSPPTVGEPQTAATPPVEEATGVLPLIPGVYVIADGDCASPANAGVRFYDRRGISGTATHACRTTVHAHSGAVYDVEQSCIDRPAGDGPRTSERQTITVHDARAFTLATADESARFHHCPADEIPDYLRGRIAGDRDGG